MDTLCYSILGSFLLASAYCSVENSTKIDKFVNKSLTIGDGIQVQNLFVASCKNIKEDLSSVKTSITDQNKQMQCISSSIEEVYNIANETKVNVIKQNTLLKNFVGSVESLNSLLESQEDQSKNITKYLESQGKQLQTLSTLVEKFVSKKKEESAIAVMSCPKDFEELKGKCYRLNENSMTWSEASAYCQEDGGFLAEPRSEMENDFIRDVIVRGGLGVTIWLGGTDQSKEGEWRWASNGDIISGYTNWYDGKDEYMNNQPRDDHEKDDCIIAWVDDFRDWFGKWVSCDCSDRYPFVCQTAKVLSVQLTNNA